MCFRGRIESTNELKSALRNVLTRVKEEIEKRPTVSMPVPVEEHYI